MPPTFASGVRACCVAGALLLTAVYAADQQSLVGQTREQVLQKFGEPKSQIVAGNREILFFNGERLVLRNGIVVEAEEVSVDAAPSPSPSNDSNANPAPASATVATGAATAAQATGNVSAAGSGTDAGNATVSPAQNPLPPPPAPEVIIKSIRPPDHDFTATAETAPAVAASNASASPAPAPAAATPVVAPAPAPVASPLVAAPSVAQTGATTTSTSTPEPSPAANVASEPAQTEGASGVAVAPVTASAAAADNGAAPIASAAMATPSAAPVKKPASTRRRITGPGPDIPNATDSVFTRQTYLITFIIIAGGIGYLWWRSRQRQLALVATAVSNSPFIAESVVGNTGTRFTAELLAKLEWKRFEELVAAYYNKTGVVAARTHSGPAAPVHIKISWKGEPRPFAFVQCLAHPAGLIDLKPVQALNEAIAAEDIRRGYVVTAGRFSVPARDLAEEKHITLLSGDIFLEKLNSLPDNARSELMREVTAGDYMTPTCPTCDVKLTRAPADPTVWQCPQCGTVLPK